MAKVLGLDGLVFLAIILHFCFAYFLFIIFFFFGHNYTLVWVGHFIDAFRET
jgi:hypothetical protein